MHVGRLGGDSRHLAGLPRLLLNLGDLLPLLRGRGDLRAQDNVPNLALGEGAHVDVVLLGIVCQDEVLEGDLHLDPLLVREARPHMVGLGDNALVRLEEHPRLVHVDVQGAQDEDQPAERCVRADGFEPVVVDVEEHHLRLCGLQDEVAKLLNLERRLERQLEFRARDDDVGEVQQVHLQGIKHPLAADDDALGLLLHRQTPYQGRNLLRCLPLGKLAKALLAGPHARVDDLEEKLASAGIEDEDRSVDGLRREVTLKSFVDRHTVHICVVDKPDDLVAEQLPIVLAREVRLCWLRGVQLKPLADSLPQDIEGRVGLHDLRHRLDDQRLHAGKPVTKRAVQVVREVDTDHDTGWGRIDGHVVGGVVQELGSDVALDVMRIVVAPAELDIDPVLVARLLVEHIVLVSHQARLAHAPLVGRKQEDVGA
mmetsp:Transcript_21771/g.52019  ORF Transcript_21771/g.52019 Transcript_21771/m.52019 type:complete len:426 (-) Transcript_21771:5117-6394(-)